MKHNRILIASILFLTLSSTPCVRAQWVATNSPTVSPVVCCISIGSNLFAGTSGNGVFISRDNGSSWIASNTGLTQQNVHVLASMGSILFAGTISGDFRSTDSGKTWNKGLITKGILAFAVKGTDLFVGTDEAGVARSTDSGRTWVPLNPGLINTATVALAVMDMNLFAGTTGNTGGGSVFRSTDDGNNWTEVNSGLMDKPVYRLLVHGPNLIAGTIGGGLFLSANEGSSWTRISTGLNNDTILALTSSGQNLFTGIFHGGVFVSTNEGVSWTQKNEGTPVQNPTVYTLYVNGTDLLAGTAGSIGVWRRPLSEMTGSSAVSAFSPASGALALYPNPASEKTTIRYTIATAGMTSIEVFNALSKNVAVLVHEPKQPGIYEATVDASSLPEGVYSFVINTGGIRETKQFVVVR